MTPKQQRLSGLALIFIGIVVAVTLSLWGLRENVSFFYTPSDLTSASPQNTFRLGGLVKENSIEKTGLETRFVIIDNTDEMLVTYTGILPDLFKESQGVIATGKLNKTQDVFLAEQLLAKHDENYMPPEVAKKLKEKGHIEKP